jgi:predicted phage-related endonuclease
MGREQWLESRRKGIGGSDWRHILSIEPYGCARRCWYDKTGVEADYPEVETGAMRRGKKMERLVVEEFVEVYQVPVWYPDDSINASEDFFQHFGRATEIEGEQIPEWWIGTPDAAVVEFGTDPVVLEVKTKGPFPFAVVKKDGPPAEEQAQAQHYLGATGWRQASIAYFEPVNWSLLPVPVGRDPIALKMMLDAGGEFWRRNVSEGVAPGRLDPRSRACKGCPWFHTCQGEVAWDGIETDGEYTENTDPAVAAMVAERVAIAEVQKDLDAALDTVNQTIIESIGAGKKVITIDGHKVRISDGSYTVRDDRKAAADHPRLWATYIQRYKVKRSGRPSVYVYPKRKGDSNG